MFFPYPSGHTLDDLMKAGHEEAVAVLNIVHGGQVPMVLYKSVGMREVSKSVVFLCMFAQCKLEYTVNVDIFALYIFSRNSHFLNIRELLYPSKITFMKP